MSGDRAPGLERFFQEQLLNALDGVDGLLVDLEFPDGSRRRIGQGTGPAHVVRVHDRRFLTRFALAGDMGLGESYMDGDWSARDLPSLLKAALRARTALPLDTRLSKVLNLVHDLWYRRRRNTLRGARQNIQAHYDLSNEFFQTFLDPSMMYSCAYFEDEAQDLGDAQRAKLRRLADKLFIRPGMRVLEMGCGWGAFAILLAQEYGAMVRGITLSERQRSIAIERVRLAGLTDRIEIVLEDFRATEGTFDRIVSVEMFEALGFENWNRYFGEIHARLAPDGLAGLQLITIPDHRFDEYRRHCDWLQRYIFPGALLGSLHHLTGEMIRGTPLTVFDLDDIGIHYERTLALWRAAFWRNIAEVRALGFDERFIRMWDYYLAVCEAAFGTRTLSDVQLVLTRPLNASIPGVPARARRAA